MENSYDKLQQALALRSELMDQLADLQSSIRDSEVEIEKLIVGIAARAKTESSGASSAGKPATRPDPGVVPDIPPKWFEILEAMAEHETTDLPALTIALGSEETTLAKRNVSSHLSRMKGHDYITAPKRGLFRMTEKGARALRAWRNATKSNILSDPG